MKKTWIRILLLTLAAALLPFACFAEEEAPGAGKPSGAILPIVMADGQTRECFFANGTPITIQEPAADTAGWVHDTEVQAALGNGFSPENRPDTGALVSWPEGEETHYIFVSGYSKVFGGSLNAPVKADIHITVKGTDVREAFPNVSFLFGGGYGGDVDGSVEISMEESQIMYLYGGGLNGSVTGDVTIRETGYNWSLDIVGGGLASSMTENAVADVGGNVTMDLREMSIGYTDSITCGGLAESISPYTAQANVDGDVTVYAEGRNVYQVCGGGEAFRTAEECGQPTANVGGNVRLELRGSRVRFYTDPRTALLGGVFAGGLACDGTADVAGSCELIVADTIFDNDALGVILGGMAEGEGASASVGGSVRGQVGDMCNPSHIVSGGITDRDGTAEVGGEVTWTHTLRNGLLES